MQEISFEEALEKIQAKDPRYHREAYLFVKEGLDHTQKTIGKDKRGRIRHVTGQELITGLRQYALAQYGPMTMTVLEEWGVHSCRDFGEIVFNMVGAGWLAKTEGDSIADFEDGYSFFDAFRKPFLPAESKKAEKAEPKSTGT